MRVYILSDYEEHGAENVRATIDKNKVVELFENLVSKWEDVNYATKCRAKLNQLLENNILTTQCGKDLGDGWGGLQLHIIELE